MVFLTLLLSVSVYAKTLETSYLKLNVPNSWQCQKIETIWSCVDPSQEVKEAFLVVTAKNIGPEDNLVTFQKSLSKTRVIQNSDGKTIQSKVNFTKKVNFKGQSWIQALHQNSEILDYNTYYMSTVTDSLAITTSLSLYNKTQKKYADIVSKIFGSIQLKQYQQEQPSQANEVSIATTDSKTSQAAGGAPFSLKKLTSGEQGSYLYIIIALLALGAVVFFFIRRKQK